MATTIQEISAILETAGILFTQASDDVLVSPWRMERYHNEHGKAQALIALHLQEGGEYLAIRAPGAFHLDGPHRMLARSVLDQLVMRWKVVNVRFDPADGEVIVLADLLVEDASVTERQLVRLLGAVLSFLDHVWCVIEAVRVLGRFEAGWLELAAEGEPLAYVQLTGVSHPTIAEPVTLYREELAADADVIISQLLDLVGDEDAIASQSDAAASGVEAEEVHPVVRRTGPQTPVVRIEEGDARSRNAALRLAMLSDLARNNRN